MTEKIIDEKKVLNNFSINKIDKSWNIFFEKETKKSYFFDLFFTLEEEYESYKCWPDKKNILRIFREIPLDKIKVVILGQDPYHLPNLADGIAFSTKKENYIPRSLMNIFLELKNDLNCSIPKKGDLNPWLKEGVFLINTALSVREKEPLSHELFWKIFISSLINYLKNYDKKIIWVFWGKKAKKIKEEFKISNDFSLTSSHPSPYSARNGFFGSKPFSKINILLSDIKKNKINWLSIL